MLVQFSVANYRSIKNRVTLSMVASSDCALKENTFPAEGDHSLDLLSTVAIYGANAAGKSNLVKALGFMREYVLSSAKESTRGEYIPIAPFRLDGLMEQQPSEFEVVFVKAGQRYSYGFSVDRRKVHSEWLTVATATKPSAVFERSPVGFRFGKKWKGDKKRLIPFTRDNALFLSVAAQFGSQAVEGAYDWFRWDLKSISDEPEHGSENKFTIEASAENHEFKRGVLAALQGADVGIHDFTVEEVPLAETQPWAKIAEPVRRAYFSEYKLDSLTKIAKFVHLGRGEQGETTSVCFGSEDESGGTCRLFALVGPWQHVLLTGSVLFVDELDRKLHPLLTRMLVQAFSNPEMNRNRAQLIFTTHDCGLLDADLFRRDQIWFAEKDEFGATDLYSLWDYRVAGIRKDENFRTGYLRGRYGAIPFIGEFTFGAAQGTTDDQPVAETGTHTYL